MAIGKPRSNRRSSGGSCSSTVTTLLLVAVCVFCVWMLISNSTSSPGKTTTRINSSLVNSLFDIEHRNVNSHRKIPVDATKDKLVDRRSNDTVSEDIRSDDDDDLNDVDTIQETSQNYPLEEDENPSGTSTVFDDDAESLNDSDVGKDEAEQEQEEAKEEELEMSTDVIEDELEGKVSTKEDEQQKMISSINGDHDHMEESSGNEYDQDDKQTEASNEDDIQDLEDNQEQEIIDEEQGKRTDNDQHEHDEDGPIESHSIAAETRAQIENQDAQDVRKKMEQAKIESMINKTNSTLIDQPKIQKQREQINSIDTNGYKWELCNVTNGANYVPCLDNEIAIRNLHHWHHDEHQERHCPDDAPVCLVPLPKHYKTPLPWPHSRDKIWLHNVPHKTLSHIKMTKEFITFPKGGTKFIHAALHYIEFLQEAVPEISWGKHTRVVLDIGCGVGSFGGYLFDEDVLAMSFASKDEQEAQIQFALERGIPAIPAVMGTQRLPFPSGVFDLVHCVNCGVPWHKDGGVFLLEANRVLRPGGYFVWSAPPVYRTLEEDVQIWKEMSGLTVAMCWELVTIKKDKVNAIGVAVYHKPDLNECYDVRKKQEPPMCKPNNDANTAWYVPLQLCMHKVPVGDMERGSHWPEEWPERVQKPPYWLNKSHIGIYGKPSPNDFKEDYEHWKRVVSKFYTSSQGISWSNIRNVMDMRAVYGGFAAALKDLKLWVLNVVNIDSPDTLPIIFERGLFGI